MKNNYPSDSVEYLIATKLQPLINEVKEKMFTDDFKRSDEYKSEASDLEALGIIVSKYCEWNGNKIEQVALEAFADSNFTANIEI